MRWFLPLASFCALGSDISAACVPRFPLQVMETRRLTCPCPPPRPRAQQSHGHAQTHQNAALAPNQAAAATTASPRCSPPANTPLSRPMPPCPIAHTTAERTQPLPLRPRPGHSGLAEKLGASWEQHHPCWEQSSGCITVTGRAGRGVSFLSRKAWGGCFVYFNFFGGLAFSLVNQKCQRNQTVPRKRTYSDELISCLGGRGEITMEILKRSHVNSFF